MIRLPVKPLQNWKAAFPIVVTEVGIFNIVKLLHPAKAPSQINLVPSLMCKVPVGLFPL